MTDPSLWNQLLIWPILNLLVAFYKVFHELSFPSPLTLAIIAMTLVIRLVLYPFTKAQLKSAQEMSKLKPKIDELSKKYKNDKTALQKAQLDLYKEHNVNPAAGCLPLLIQFPVLIALYRVFFQLLSSTDMQSFVNDINTIVYHPALTIQSLDLSFFGTSLSVKPSDWQQYGIWLLSIPIITAVLQWLQTKTMMMNQPKIQQVAVKTKKKGNKQEEAPVDTQQEIQKQMAMITPIMFGVFAYQFPLGLALYWNTFGLFGIMQQKLMERHG